MNVRALPLARAEKIVSAFVRLGWTRAPAKSRKGNHIILTKAGSRCHLSVPNHKGRDVNRIILQGLIDDAGITVDEFLAKFKR